MTPSSGSADGGDVIRIAGKGFGYEKDDVRVKVDDVPCDVINVTMSKIYCRTGEKTAGAFDVKVSQIFYANNISLILFSP